MILRTMQQLDMGILLVRKFNIELQSQVLV